MAESMSRSCLFFWLARHLMVLVLCILPSCHPRTRATAPSSSTIDEQPTSGDADRSEERTSGTEISIAAPIEQANSTGHIDHDSLVSALRTSTMRVRDFEGTECVFLAGEGNPTLGEVVIQAIADADEQRSECAMVEVGHQCTTIFQNSTGGEEAEFMIELRYQIESDGELVPNSLQCFLAG